MAQVTELPARTEPTDRSSSPAIIKSPTGKAMMPSSLATFSQLATPPTARKSDPPKMAKKMNMPTVPTSAPASDRGPKRARDHPLLRDTGPDASGLTGLNADPAPGAGCASFVMASSPPVLFCAEASREAHVCLFRGRDSPGHPG